MDAEWEWWERALPPLVGPRRSNHTSSTGDRPRLRYHLANEGEGSDSNDESDVMVSEDESTALTSATNSFHPLRLLPWLPSIMSTQRRDEQRSSTFGDEEVSTDAANDAGSSSITPRIVLSFLPGSCLTIGQSNVPLDENLIRIIHGSDDDDSCDHPQRDKGRLDEGNTTTLAIPGYVRENRTRLEECGFQVRVTTKALLLSDRMYRKKFDPLYQQRKLRMTPGKDPTYALLEEVLDICRLHRLEEDLDLFSLYCMRNASKLMGKMAGRMLRRKLLQPCVTPASGIVESSLLFIPFVDGTNIAGRSRFVRSSINRDADGNLDTDIHYERRRPVEYVSCKLMRLKHVESDHSRSAHTTPDAAFVSQSPLQNWKPPQDNSRFSWSCQELCLAFLDRMLGDIAIREYVGQKLCLYWQCSGADAFLFGSEEGHLLKLFDVRMEASPRLGYHCWKHASHSHTQVRFVVREQQSVQTDSVTMDYRGSIDILSLDLDFRTVIRAHAQHLLKQLEKQHEHVLKSRPLFEREERFLAEVRSACTL